MAKKAENKKLNNKSNINILEAVNNSSSENPHKIGDIVLALAGRDEDRLFVVIGIADKDYVLIADGRSRRIDSPKKKKVRHIKLVAEDFGIKSGESEKSDAAGDLKQKYLKSGGFTNLILKNIIAEYVKNSTKINNLK